MRESCGPSEEPMRFCEVSEDEGVTRQTWRRRCKECWTAHKGGRDGRKKCRRGRGDRSYQGTASACIGHSARWTERGAGSSRRGAQSAHGAEMARPPELGWARRVMRDAGARTWDQYLDKVRRGEIWGGACEVGRWAQSRGCRVAKYQEWGPQGVYRKMAEVGEGKRTAAALLWSRRGGGHYELLWPPGEEGAEAVAGADAEEGTESKGDAEVTMVEELAEEGPEKGGGERERTEEHMWRDVHQIPIQEGGGRWRYQGQEGPGRERRGVGGGTARDRKKLGEGWEGVLGVQVQEMEYMEVSEGTGKGEWHRRQAGGVDVWVTGGGEAGLQLQHREDVGTGRGAERAVQIRPDRAVWLEPGWTGRYRVVAGGR